MLDHVRASIIEYLAARFDADDLATRLPDGWELDESGTDEARTLTLRAMGYLAEYQRGDRTEADLRSVLSSIVEEAPAPRIGNKTRVFQRKFAVTTLRLGGNKSPQGAPA